MKRILAGLGALALLGLTVAWSRTNPARPEFDFSTEKLNPVTHLKLNNSPDDFQFAIVSDRTGGHRPKVFSRAIDQLNLLQPEFVVSVGDLIEGYTADKKEIDRQWREFQGYVSRLQMPFFYVAGNHDLANKTMARNWAERFGRTYYSFVRHDVLFVALDSEDPPNNKYGKVGADQLAWLKKTLDANKSARWTLVFLHRPMWVMPDLDDNGWLDVEKLLADRKHTVFAGHVHRYQKFARNGADYYMLGTTGGVSKMRGPEYGEVDHLVWVTMKKDGPALANVLLDGILREDLATTPSEEEGVKEYFHRPTSPTTVKVLLDGKPLTGAYVVLQGIGKEPRQPRADGLTGPDGVVKLSTYAAYDGAPAGEYAVLLERRVPLFLPDGKRGPNLLPATYADVKTTPLRAEIVRGKHNDLLFNLTSK